jgi:hypothetical protein
MRHVLGDTPALASATTRDVLLSIALFLGPPLAAMLIRILMVAREIREERRRDQAEAEALRAEGFPPGHPTHHRPSNSDST